MAPATPGCPSPMRGGWLWLIFALAFSQRWMALADLGSVPQRCHCAWERKQFINIHENTHTLNQSKRRKTKEMCSSVPTKTVVTSLNWLQYMLVGAQWHHNGLVDTVTVCMSIDCILWLHISKQASNLDARLLRCELCLFYTTTWFHTTWFW